MINLTELEEKDYNVLLSLEDQFSDLPLRIGTLQTGFGWGYNRTFLQVESMGSLKRELQNLVERFKGCMDRGSV